MILYNNLLLPLKINEFNNKFIGGFTLPGIGNLSHTRTSNLTRNSTSFNKLNLLKLLNIKNSNFFSPFQIHTDCVVEVNSNFNNNGLHNAHNAIKCDSCFTRIKNTFLLTTWADCVPIILYDFKNEICASVHSGWKSTRLSIVSKTIDNMLKKGGSTETILAAIGPSIRKCCYQVGNEFKEYFKGYENCFIEKENKLYFDPSEVVYQQLVLSGIKIENIEHSNFCTCCSVEPYFHSYRRDPINFEGQGAFAIMI